MRAIPDLLTLILLAAGATGARANLSMPVDRQVGALTCTVPGTMPEVETEAACVYVSDRDETRQTYAARIRSPPSLRRETARALTPRVLMWRVLTRNGAERPGMLLGTFADATTWRVVPFPTGAPVLIGPKATLRPRGVADGAGAAELRLDAVSTVAAR